MTCHFEKNVSHAKKNYLFFCIHIQTFFYRNICFKIKVNVRRYRQMDRLHRTLRSIIYICMYLVHLPNMAMIKTLNIININNNGDVLQRLSEFRNMQIMSNVIL